MCYIRCASFPNHKIRFDKRHNSASLIINHQSIKLASFLFRCNSLVSLKGIVCCLCVLKEWDTERSEKNNKSIHERERERERWKYSDKLKIDRFLCSFMWPTFNSLNYHQFSLNLHLFYSNLWLFYWKDNVCIYNKKKKKKREKKDRIKEGGETETDKNEQADKERPIKRIIGLRIPMKT